MKNKLVLILSVWSVLLFSADLLQIRRGNELAGSRIISCGNGYFTLLSPGSAQSVRVLKFEPGKKYKISADVRVSPGAAAPVRIYLSLCPLDKNGRRIFSENVFVISGTETVLTGAARAGEDTIEVKDASKWDNSHVYSCAAFYAEKDFSDLPNTALEWIMTGSIEKENGKWEITLAKPLKKDYPAGTAVRQHIRGGTWIHAVSKRPAGSWQKLAGIISGDVLRSGCSDGQLWPGTEKVRLIISSAGRGKADIRNIRISEIR